MKNRIVYFVILVSTSSAHKLRKISRECSSKLYKTVIKLTKKNAAAYVWIETTLLVEGDYCTRSITR